MNDKSCWVVVLGWLASSAALAGPAEELWLCKDGIASGPGRTLLARDAALLPALFSLDSIVPGLKRTLDPLRRGGCLPTSRVAAALQAPLAGTPNGPACSPPADPEDQAHLIEEGLISQWQSAWRTGEAVRRGLGTFLDLANFMRRLDRNDPAALAKYAKFITTRAKPVADELEVWMLPARLPTAADDLWALAGRAAREFVEGHANHRAARLAALEAQEPQLQAALVQDTLELNRLAGEVAGTSEEARGLARLAPRLSGAGAALEEARARIGQRLARSLRDLIARAQERATRARERCAAAAEARGLQRGDVRLIPYPTESIPAGFVAEAASLLAAPESGDPVSRGIWILQLRKQKPAPVVAQRAPRRPRRPPKHSALRLEEDGAERSAPDDRPGAGQPSPVDAAVATRTSHVQACGLGNGSACYQAGLACEAGSGGPRDPTAARNFFRRACEAAFDLGCYQLGTYLLSGVGGPPDLVQGRALLQRACRAKIDKACKRLQGL